MLRLVTVGPPPTLAWTTPVAQDITAGGVSTGALLGWETSLPDTAPTIDNPATNPYIARVEILIDGRPWFNVPTSGAVPWAGYRTNVKTRDAAYNVRWDSHSSLPVESGWHTATLRVTTSYGSVATSELRFIVDDGVVFSPVTSAGRPVNDGFVVTAGDRVPLRANVTTKIPGSSLTWWDLTAPTGDSLADAPNGCILPQWWTCSDSHAFNSTWTAPSTPGRYKLTFSAQAHGDQAPTSMTRTVVVRARAAAPLTRATLTRAVSRSSVRKGKPVKVTGRLARIDNKRGLRAVPVTLQWRAKGSTKWTPVKTVKTNSAGRLALTVVVRKTGAYRWTTAGLAGKIGPAASAPVTVKARRGHP